MSSEQMRRELAGTFEHDMVSIAAAGSITINAGSGTDTATNRYLNLPAGVSYGIEVIPTVACSISKINGRSLKAGVSVGTGGWRAETGKFLSVTIAAGTATTVQIYGKC